MYVILSCGTYTKTSISRSSTYSAATKSVSRARNSYYNSYSVSASRRVNRVSRSRTYTGVTYQSTSGSKEGRKTCSLSRTKDNNLRLFSFQRACVKKFGNLQSNIMKKFSLYIEGTALGKNTGV